MMKAGWGTADMTPPIGVELAGYGYYLGRRATHVQDALYARVVALEYVRDAAPPLRYAIVCCDVLGLSMPVVSAVLSHLQAAHGVSPTHAVVVSIHTHTGPALKYHEGCGEVSPDYAATAADPILRACDDAFTDLTAVRALSGGCAPLPEAFAYNRACPEGPVDPLVRGFRIDRAGAPPIAIASYACHPVLRGRSTGISADYPGQVCAQLAQAGMRPLYLNGLCGDIDPIPVADDARTARCDVFARAIVEGYMAALAPLPQTIRGEGLSYALKLLSVTPGDIRRIAEQAMEKATDQGAQRVARTWAAEMLDARGPLPAQEVIAAACLWLGGIPILALPVEGYGATGDRIRARLGDPRALILGCAQELLGYLPTIDDIDRKGYAALESAFLYKRLPPSPGEAERLGDAFGDMLAQARNA